MMRVNTTTELFELADMFQYSAQLFFGYHVGLFEYLEDRKGNEAVAQHMGWVPWKTAIYLDGLVALGLLEKSNSEYKNSTIASQCLVKRSPGFIGDLIEHEGLQWSLWGDMGQVLRSREIAPQQLDARLKNDSYAFEVFQRAMLQISQDVIPQAVEDDRWADCRYILDLAGGHGAYLCALAKRNPNLHGEVWDLESARKICENEIQNNGLVGRVKFVAKDIVSRQSYEDVHCDGVMLHHCLHHFTIEDVSVIIENIRSIIRAPGVVSVLVPALSADRTEPARNALFSTFMMMNRKNGCLHATSDIVQTLEKHGFQVIQTNLDNLEMDSLLMGRLTND